MPGRHKNPKVFNEDECLSLPKWSLEYKRTYQQLTYRFKRGDITPHDYNIFMKLKSIEPQQRNKYNIKDEDTIIRFWKPPPSVKIKKLKEPVVITFD